MNRKGIFVLGLVLSTFFAVSLASSVFASTWLYYDPQSSYTTGELAQSERGDMKAVRFSLPAGWTSARILTGRFYIAAWEGYPFTLRILNHDRTATLYTSPQVTPTSDGWFDVDVSSANIIVAGDFHIAMEWTDDNDVFGDIWDAPSLGFTGGPTDRSWKFTGSWLQETGRFYAIRAEIENTQEPEGEPSAVGGDVFQIDKLAILSPYLIVALVILTATSFLIMKRKH